MDKKSLFRIIVLISVAVLIFLYIAASCSAVIERIEQDALCRHFGYADSHITWDGFLDGTGEYTVECVDYVPLK